MTSMALRRGLVVTLALLAGCEDDGGVARDGSSSLDGGEAGALEVGAGDGSADRSADGGDAADARLDPDALMVSALAREIIAAPTAEVASLTADNRRFALRLWKAVQAGGADNLVSSPHSLSVALAMTFGGARGETAAEMVNALELRLPGADLHRAFNALDQELARRSQPLTPAEGEAPKLTIINAVWGRRDYRFLPAYLDLLSVNYGAGIYVLDFAGDPEGSRLGINRWVEDQTSGRIVDLLKVGAILPSTALVLTNAVFFKASWAQSFAASATMPAPFTVVRGAMRGPEVSVPTMVRQGSLRHVATADCDAVELPYAGGKLAMLLILPRPEREAAFEAALTAAQLDAVVAGLTAKEVKLSLPRFQFSSDLKLRPVLTALGMPAAFSSQADFSGMNGIGGLQISDVVHQAFVAVDEKGTEAAAATAVVVGPPSIPVVEAEVRFDRPFLFFVRDVPTGAVLFFGRVVDPRS